MYIVYIINPYVTDISNIFQQYNISYDFLIRLETKLLLHEDLYKTNNSVKSYSRKWYQHFYNDKKINDLSINNNTFKVIIK